MKSGRSFFHSLLWFMLIFLSGIPGAAMLAQEGNEADGDQADSLAILPIPATQITTEYDESLKLISRSGDLQLSEKEIKELETQLDTVFSLVDNFLEDSILKRMDGANIRELDYARNLVNNQVDNIADFQTLLSRRTKEIESATLDLTQAGLRWQLTREGADARGVPEALKSRMDQVIGEIDSVNLLLQEDFNTLLMGEDALASRNKQLKGIQDSIRVRRIQLGESLLIVDMPSYFQELAAKGDSAMISTHLAELERAFQLDIKFIRNKFKSQIWIILLLTGALLIGAFWFKKNYRQLIPEDQFKLSDTHLVLIESPVATTLFVVALMVRFFFGEFAHAMQAINLFLLMAPLIIILLRKHSESASPWIELLVAGYILTFSYEILFYLDILQRTALLLLSMGGFAFFLMMVLKKSVIFQVKSTFVFKMLRLILGLFALMCFVAIFANLIGAFRMAEYFTIAFMQITILALVTYVAVLVLDGLVFFFLASKPMQRLHLVKDEFLFLQRKIYGVLNFFLWIYFVFGTLDLLNVKEPFLEWGNKILNTGRTLGEVEITPANILIFIFIIWLSVFLSRLITKILEKDVFTRVTVSRGMPNTINMLLKIALISGGFFLAAAAAGMELSNLSIIIGAFSVGIGFGLQNIFNNMVSGLILAFERPIKVGDTVEVGTLTGVVKKISFRSSTIKSFDGAEVIVPNGNLISDSMTNWTLSDHHRRMDIRVGVAYGTDPDLVLGLLREVAEEHESVRKKPEPSAFFIGFGDSSLDFRLLAWTDIEKRLRTESELNVLVNKKLDEAGIEIPFPQRDLHIRSDDTKT